MVSNTEFLKECKKDLSSKVRDFIASGYALSTLNRCSPEEIINSKILDGSENFGDIIPGTMLGSLYQCVILEGCRLSNQDYIRNLLKECNDGIMLGIIVGIPFVTNTVSAFYEYFRTKKIQMDHMIYPK